MKRASWLVLVFSVAWAVPGVAQTPDSLAAYRALLQRAESGDTTVNFTELRLRHAASPDYQPYGSSDHGDSLVAALDRNDFKRAALEGDSLLAESPLSIQGRLMRAYAADQLGDTVALQHHRDFAFRLLRSLEASGDGTRQHPFVVIAVEEEYAYLRMHGLQSESQVLAECQGPCDLLHTRARDGSAQDLYFDVHLPMQQLNRLLDEKPQKKKQ